MEFALNATKTGNYQFPVAALTPAALPHINEAMAACERDLFERHESYLVDSDRHANFCVLSYKAGLLGPEDVEGFVSHPRLLDLHRITTTAVQRLGRAFSFSADSILEADRHRYETALTSPEVDKEFVAEVAIGLSLASKIDHDQLYSLVSKGAYTAPLVADLCNASLKALCEGEGLYHEAYLSSNAIVLVAGQPTYYDFDLTRMEDTEARFELSVLMQKAFDAINVFLFPLHTPATFVGTHSYFNPSIDEAISALKGITSDFSPEGLMTLLSSMPPQMYPFDAEVLGVCEDDDGEVDEDSMQRMVETLSQCHRCMKDYSYTLSAESESARDSDFADVLMQARERAKGDSPVAVIYANIVQILEYVDSHRGAVKHDLYSMNTHEDGIGFFETFIIRMDEHEVAEAYCEAYSYIDMVMSEYGSAGLVLEAADRDVVARSIVPKMGAIQQINTLLNHLSSTIEATYA